MAIYVKVVPRKDIGEELQNFGHFLQDHLNSQTDRVFCNSIFFMLFLFLWSQPCTFVHSYYYLHRDVSRDSCKTWVAKAVVQRMTTCMKCVDTEQPNYMQLRLLLVCITFSTEYFILLSTILFLFSRRQRRTGSDQIGHETVRPAG